MNLKEKAENLVERVKSVNKARALAVLMFFCGTSNVAQANNKEDLVKGNGIGNTNQGASSNKKGDAYEVRTPYDSIVEITGGSVTFQGLRTVARAILDEAAFNAEVERIKALVPGCSKAMAEDVIVGTVVAHNVQRDLNDELYGDGVEKAQAEDYLRNWNKNLKNDFGLKVDGCYVVTADNYNEVYNKRQANVERNMKHQKRGDRQ